jgi:transposase
MQLDRNSRTSGTDSPALYGYYPYSIGIFALTGGVDTRIYGVITFTIMPKQSQPQTKRQALQASGTFNLRSSKVRHALFQRSEFFDPEDLLQLKYETLRALKAEGRSIAQAANEFGLSRPTIYQAQAIFAEKGVEGLLPHKTGPKHPRKLTLEVRQHLQELAQAEPEVGASELARRVRQRFNVKLHPRTIEKALHGRAKRGRQIPP